jgi:hypothetical protein
MCWLSLYGIDEAGEVIEVIFILGHHEWILGGHSR